MTRIRYFTEKLNPVVLKAGKRKQIQRAIKILEITTGEFVRQAIDEKLDKVLKK